MEVHTAHSLGVRIIGVTPTADNTEVLQLDVVAEGHNLTLDQARAAVQWGVVWVAVLPPDVHLEPPEVEFEVTEVEGPSQDTAELIAAREVTDIEGRTIKSNVPVDWSGSDLDELVRRHVEEQLTPKLEMTVPPSVNQGRRRRWDPLYFFRWGRR